MRYLWILLTAIIFSNVTNGQVSLTFNIDSQPIWGPAGYDYVEYYYLPELEIYYSVTRNRFFYYQDERWISRTTLPSRYRNYDLFKSYKIIVNEREPWRFHDTHKKKYKTFKDRHDQMVIRDSRDTKYFNNKNHPQNKNWKQQNKNKSQKNNKKEE